MGGGDGLGEGLGLGLGDGEGLGEGPGLGDGLGEGDGLGDGLGLGDGDGDGHDVMPAQQHTYPSPHEPHTTHGSVLHSALHICSDKQAQPLGQLTV